MRHLGHLQHQHLYEAAVDVAMLNLRLCQFLVVHWHSDGRAQPRIVIAPFGSDPVVDRATHGGWQLPPSAMRARRSSYYIEDYVSQAPGFSGVLNSLVTEGVFHKFPRLKVVLIESGVTWLPAHFSRIDKTGAVCARKPRGSIARHGRSFATCAMNCAAVRRR